MTKLINLAVFSSSSGASTSSSKQKGAGLIENNENTRAKAVRAFSPPESENLVLELHKNLLIKKILIKRDNCFENYFDKILISIKKKDFSKFYREILADQEFRNFILNSSEDELMSILPDK